MDGFKTKTGFTRRSSNISTCRFFDNCGKSNEQEQLVCFDGYTMTLSNLSILGVSNIFSCFTHQLSKEAKCSEWVFIKLFIFRKCLEDQWRWSRYVQGNSNDRLFSYLPDVCMFRVSSDQMFAYLPRSGGFVVCLWLHIVWSAAGRVKYFKQAIQTFLNYFKQTLCSFQIKFEPKR